jgi:hypothetical protein
VPSPNTDFIVIAAGDYHSLGLKSNGSIIAWGDNFYGQCNVPEPNTNFIAIAAGLDHNIGLKNDGSIIAWGNNIYGQCNVPEPNTDFIAIAAGMIHNLGLKTDGSIIAWGDNEYNQCDIPEPNTDFIAVAAGWDHSLGLKANGSIIAWGQNQFHQCDVPEPNTEFIAIAASGFHCLGLQKNHPPVTPSKPVGPHYAWPDKPSVFFTTTTDPNEDPVSYQWDWGDGNISDWIGPYESGELSFAVYTWTHPGTYQIRVKAKDTNGAESNWSEPLTMRIMTIQHHQAIPIT